MQNRSLSLSILGFFLLVFSLFIEPSTSATFDGVAVVEKGGFSLIKENFDRIGTSMDSRWTEVDLCHVSDMEAQILAILENFEAFIDKIIPSDSVTEKEPCMPTFVKYAANRCDACLRQYGPLSEVTEQCKQRVKALNVFMRIIRRLKERKFNEYAMRPEYCNAIEEISKSIRRPLSELMFYRSRYLNHKYTTLPTDSSQELANFERLHPEVLIELRRFDAALEEAHMNICIHCGWSIMDLDILNEVRDYASILIYLAIF